MNVRAALHEAQSILRKLVNNNEEKLEAQLLLEHVLNVNKAWLIAHADDAISAKDKATFEALIQRRIVGEPIAYILGEREFYGLSFKVTADTLIPRPDTETLVEAALAKIATPSFPSNRESVEHFNQTTSTIDAHFRGNDRVKVLDLGTGTGAIALAIAKYCPAAQVVAVDASESALKVAAENAQSLNMTNVRLVLSNWFEALEGEQFDMIVSNPPYIEENDVHLKQGDLRFEPLAALAAGKDGLDDIRQIISSAPQHLNPKGWLLLEHGYNQAEAVAALLHNTGFSEISTQKDLGNNDRITLAQKV